MKIRAMTEDDMLKIGHFPPDEWNMDIVAKFQQVYGKTEFFPFLCECGCDGECEDTIVGIGSTLVNGNVGWLGHIIVLSEHQRQGIGQKLTEYLIGFLTGKGCKSLLLTATEMGAPVYEKCSFTASDGYRLYSGESVTPLSDELKPTPASESDREDIFELDRVITGEDRSHLLRLFCSNAFLKRAENGTLSGFYIPGYGDGFIAAADEKTGTELLHFKLSTGKKSVLVPIKNGAAIQFLEDQGFTEGYEIPRMVWGKEVNWNQSGIFSRAGGDCG